MSPGLKQFALIAAVAVLSIAGLITWQWATAPARPVVAHALTVPAADLRRLTLAAHPRAIVIMPDAVYCLPTEAWLVGPFSTSFRDFTNGQGLSYQARGWDCDKYAGLFRSLAQVGFAHDSAQPGEGLAIGELYYTKDGAGGHAIDVALCGSTLIYLEPQTCQTVTLSPAELRSVSFVHW